MTSPTTVAARPPASDFNERGGTIVMVCVALGVGLVALIADVAAGL
jgi:hypothetical protein